MVIYKIKRFSATGIGLLGGMTAGAYLGQKAHKKLAGHRAYMNYNPENEISKIERELNKDEEEVNKLRSNEDYMKRYRSAKEKYEKGHKGISHLSEEDPHQWGIEARQLDEELDNEIPEGNIESIEDDIRNKKEKIRSIRENVRNARIKARKNAEDFEEGRTGMLIGTGLGLVVGGALGSRIGN